MAPKTDYHLHTSLCGHATGEPEEYVLQAQKIGLKEIGFSDHSPLLTYTDPTLTMSLEELPKYHKIIDRLQKKFAPFSIKRGIEVDYSPGIDDKIKELLSRYEYDYVIGSIHHIGRWAFDHPKERDEWDENDVNDVYKKYYELLRQCAQSELFDIMAHVDLVKKFGHRATDDLTHEVEKTAKIFKKTGVAIEINSSGLRKPVKEIYPSLDALSVYCKAGVPIVFGSDSHIPQDVGRDFDKAAQLAKDAGYKEYVMLSGRKIARIEKL